ncbi:MAG TPA: HAD family hydrolase [Deltaproteobacteria bacterium]|nr:HAD family hydrolase [Deltaproteobacteria bacterium]
MKQIAALFDMDHTLTWKNSGLTAVQFARKQGMVPFDFLLLGIFKIALYRLSLLNIDDWYERNMRLLAGLTMEEIEGFSRAWFEDLVRKAIYRQAVAVIEEHRSLGHRLVVISNSPPFFVKPLADAVGIPETITSRVEVHDGRLTGRLIKPLCYGRGKRDYAVRWAAEQGVDLSRSYFYTDSFYDMDLLHEVGYPVATNPDRRLMREAKRNDWRVVSFRRESAF